MHAPRPSQSRTSSPELLRSPTRYPPSLQRLPASLLLLIAKALNPPVLKHTFRPPGYRAAHRSLLAASLTCNALRSVCFPLAIRVFRSPGLKPQRAADLGESARELETKIDFLLEREPLWPFVRKLDVEIHARGSASLASKLAKLFTILPNLNFVSLKLPTYHVFRDAFTTHLRVAMETSANTQAQGIRLRELCIDACSVWMLPYFTGIRELVVWGWPSEVDRQGGLNRSETADGWRTFLFGVNTQAPRVKEVEVGGLSIYDVNELFPSLANHISDVTSLRILHRKEEHGAVALDNPLVAQCIPPDIIQATRALWEDYRDDQAYEGQPIRGYPGSVKRILYFDLQEECGSCYVPSSKGPWVDEGPALVLNTQDVMDSS